MWGFADIDHHHRLLHMLLLLLLRKEVSASVSVPAYRRHVNPTSLLSLTWELINGDYLKALMWLQDPSNHALSL